jgi:hypothetical protein
MGIESLKIYVAAVRCAYAFVPAAPSEQLRRSLMTTNNTVNVEVFDMPSHTACFSGG